MNQTTGQTDKELGDQDVTDVLHAGVKRDPTKFSTPAMRDRPLWAFGTGQTSIVPTSYMLGPEVHASVMCVGFTNDPHSFICRKATRLVSPWHATRPHAPSP
jgi:hypothetical protein